MFYNNVSNIQDSKSVKIDLSEGLYELNLYNLESSLTGEDKLTIEIWDNSYAEWKYADDTGSYMSPIFGNIEIPFSDLSQNPNILLNVKIPNQARFSAFNGIYFSEPQPILDFELLADGEISVLPVDSMGVVQDNIISTDSELGAVDTATLSSSFFNNNVDLTLLGEEGTAALWVTDPGLHLVTFDYDDDFGRLLLWDGANAEELSLVQGENTVLFDAVTDEWGFIVLDAVKKSDNNILRIENIEPVSFANADSLGENVVIKEYGDIREASLVSNTYSIATGTGDVTASFLGYQMGDRSLFEGLGVEGSGVRLSGLEQGIYEFNIIKEQLDYINNDTFWVNNGRETILVADTNGSSYLLETIEVPYGELIFAALDNSNKENTSRFTVENLQKVGDLPYELIELEPAEVLGDTEKVNIFKYEVGTGTGDRAASTLGRDLAGDRSFFKPYGTEGSYITFDVSNGAYEFVAYANKVDTANNDTFYAYNGRDLVAISDSQGSLNLKNNNTIDVIYNQLSFIALDSGTTTGTTDFILSDLTRTGDLPYSPPVPISLTPDDYSGDVDILDTQTRVGSGTGDYAVSTLSPLLNGMDLSSYGTEGSFATWNNLQNGTYEITYSLYVSENDVENDDIYFYNGTELELFDSRSSADIQYSATRWISETTTKQVTVDNGQLTLITLDTVDKSGTTQLRISKIEKVPDAYNNDYNNQEILFDISGTLTDPDNRVFTADFSLTEDSLIDFSPMVEGNRYQATIYDSSDNQLYQGWGDNGEGETYWGKYWNFVELPAGDYSLELELDPLNEFFNDSTYNLTAVIPSSDNDLGTLAINSELDVLRMGTLTTTDNKVVYTFTLNNQSELDISADMYGNRYWISIIDSQGDIQAEGWGDDSNEFLLNYWNSITLDAGDYGVLLELDPLNEFFNDSSYNFRIELLSETLDDTIDDQYQYFYEEPPFPIPENNKDLGNDYLTGLNLGTLKPWESDSDTGTEYNQGYIYPSYHLGASYINETIGGEDVSDWMLFDLDETSYLNFFHNGVIAEIVDSNQQVVVGSNDSYSGNLQAQLQPGSYGIQFSSESTLPELFNASIYLSVNDPNYAD